MKSKYLATISLVFISFTFGCGEYELLEYHKECKKSADSLYKANRDSLTKLASKLCDAQYDSLYTIALDSMKAAKRSDIIKLIGK